MSCKLLRRPNGDIVLSDAYAELVEDIEWWLVTALGSGSLKVRGKEYVIVHPGQEKETK